MLAQPGTQEEDVNGTYPDLTRTHLLCYKTCIGCDWVSVFTIVVHDV